VLLDHVLVDARGRVVVEQVEREEAHGPRGADACGAAELCGEHAQALLAARDEHERGARLRGEAARGGFADPAGCARDQHHSRIAGGVGWLWHGLASSLSIEGRRACWACERRTVRRWQASLSDRQPR
jgi:hypothetical protein